MSDMLEGHCVMIALDSHSRNRREIEAKYCARQAELGIGDCGGLRVSSRH